MRRRDHWTHRINRLHPTQDHEEISRILVQHEFPWDINQALSFALFRTYAVPSIGRLLHETGEFTERTQKRYDDTGLILDEVLRHGLSSPQGRAAVRRMNQMHGMYAISNDDMRYVLSTFVVVPVRWLADFGWRPMSPAEVLASTTYYRRLGQHMNIKDLPQTYAEFARLLDDYEAEHFGYDAGARAVADATLDLMTTFPPHDRLPAERVKAFSFGLMDEPLLDAFRYPHPSPAVRRAARAALRARARALRLAPPRRAPKLLEDMPNIRSYPDGYRTEELGTFVPTCPAHLQRRPEAALDPASV
jgi:hypothetical protein